MAWTGKAAIATKVGPAARVLAALVLAGCLLPQGALASTSTARSAVSAANIAAGTDPRLSLIASFTSGPSDLFHMTPDGAHLYERTEQKLNPADPADWKLYDIYAGRARMITHGGSFPRVLDSNESGSAVVFTTDAALTPDDTDTATDIYIESPSGVHLVTKRTLGPYFEYAAMADDGSAVVFASREQLVGVDPVPSTTPDLFRWREDTDQIEWLTPGTYDAVTYVASTPDLGRVLFRSNEDLDGIPGPQAMDNVYERVNGQYVLRFDGSFHGASYDMSRVYFASGFPYTGEEPNDGWDGYVWNSTTDTYELLTPGTPTPSDLGPVSDDGSRWVVITPDPLDPLDVDGAEDAYLLSRGAKPILISRTGDHWIVRGNADLSVLVVRTTAALVPADSDGAADWYRIEAGNLDSAVLMTGPVDGNPSSNVLQISPDGNRIAFQTAEALVPEDSDTFIDYYVWQSSGLVLITPGVPRNVLKILISRDASRIAFQAQEKLLPADANGYPDWYVVDFDIVPPKATIFGPQGATASRSADLTFSETGNAARTECRIDGGSWSVCPPSLHLDGLADGAHSAEMKAWDAVGNEGSAVRTWIVDTAAPTGSISIASGSPYTTSTTVAVAVPASDAGSGVSQMALSNDGTTWTTKPYAASTSWQLSTGDGSKTVWARWRDGAGNWSTAKPDTIVLDTVGPTGSISVASGSRYATSTTVAVTVPALDSGSGVSTVALSNDGTTWITKPYAAATSWQLLAGDGSKMVSARWRDGAGNWSTAKTDAIVLDTVAPAAERPRISLPTGTLPGGGVLVALGWGGTDATSGIARYELAQSLDGAAFTTVSADPQAQSVTPMLAVSHRYQFRVRAVDRAGNVSAWATAKSFEPAAVAESAASLSYSGTWSNVTGAGYLGGAARRATAAGAAVTYVFSGRSVAWLAARGPSLGRVTVYVDGTSAGTIDLYRTTTSNRQVVFSRAWPAVGTHTIRLVNQATVGHPGAVVDGFLTLIGVPLGHVSVAR